MSAPAKHPDELENTFIDARVNELLPKFEALAIYKPRQRERGKGDVIGWKALAAMESALLKATYPDDESPNGGHKPESDRTYGTCLRQITALKKDLKAATKTELKDPGNYHPVNTIIRHFGEALSFQFSEYKFKQNAAYREKVAHRSQSDQRIELDLTEQLKEAHRVLELAQQGAENIKDVDWRDVSLAVALCTGRRMAEVHLSGGFRVLDEYTVGFRGQLKGKSAVVYYDRNGLRQRCSNDDFLKMRRLGQLPADARSIPIQKFELEVPTLVKADLIVDAIAWLEANEKRLSQSEDPERVNRRWSKVLNQRAKLWDFLPDGENMTYHKMRAGYVACHLNNAKVKLFDYLEKIRWILGDNDESTIRAYQRYEIKPGSVTRL